MSFLITFAKLFVYKTSKIVPNRWVFTSYAGKYSDNPRALSEILHRDRPDIEIVWLASKETLPSIPNYVCKVDIDSLRAARYQGSAQVLIDNVYAGNAAMIKKGQIIWNLKSVFLLFFHRKKGQYVYSTFHGTPLKKIGRDQIGNENIIGCRANKMTMISPNSFSMEIMKHVTFNSLKYITLGYPRNDCLFNDVNIVALKQRLGVPNKKIVLFAPTFRSDGVDATNNNISKSGIDQLNNIDFDSLFDTLNMKFGGDWVFICRFHYIVSQEVDWNYLSAKYGDKIINGNISEDISDYYKCADLLITDASSAMFDYIITERPCFLFFPDINHYENMERGFYTDIRKLPFSIAINNDSLIENIRAFDYGAYIKQIRALKTTYGYAEDGNSSKRILSYILAEVNNDKQMEKLIKRC